MKLASRMQGLFATAGVLSAVALSCSDNGETTASGGASTGGSSTATGVTSSGSGGTAEGGLCASFYPEDLAGHYAAPDGSADGDGSEANPWDLQTALSHPAALLPGDTLWLRGGVYTGAFSSSLAGESGSPITVRSYPGEWAVVDGAAGPGGEVTFAVDGAWTLYRDFEVTNTYADRYGDRPGGVQVYGENLQLVNLVIHDTGGNGFWDSALELELYGCLIYANGYDDDDRAHGHGVYTQNSMGRKHIVDNAIFNGYSFGIHAYTEGGSIQNFDIIGNIWFNSGISAVGENTLKDNCLVGGFQPAAGVVLQDNIGWADSPSTRSVRLGYSNPDNEDVTLTANFFVGATNFPTPWQSITMTDNTFLGALNGISPDDYPENAYPTAPPAEPTIIVRPNQYEPGRAHVAVYNWNEADAVDVDLGDLLPTGMAYEIRNIQNYFGGAVVAGVYDGAPIRLPMDLEPVQPVGVPDAIADSEKTGRRFNAFVVLPQRCLPTQ